MASIVRALLNVAAMRCDDDAVRLVPGVLGHLEEPGPSQGGRIDHLGLDHPVDLDCAAQSLAAGEAGAETFARQGS